MTLDMCGMSIKVLNVSVVVLFATILISVFDHYAYFVNVL